ncbi:hypothetical protein B484DRAFT_479442 [Ochromonadaceae sp. CCMP2298]|nr:hypothetical protein B484DRAFT_479442 [Ochromonadaceae sp. CCMP2298]
MRPGAVGVGSSGSVGGISGGGGSISGRIGSVSGGDMAHMAPREQARAAQLADELRDLKRKIDRANSRLAQRDTGAAGSLAREVAMEKELTSVQQQTLRLKAQRERLQMTVVELRKRLGEGEDVGGWAGGPSFSSAFAQGAPASQAMEQALRRGQREKRLETMVRARKQGNTGTLGVEVLLKMWEWAWGMMSFLRI